MIDIKGLIENALVGIEDIRQSFKVKYSLKELLLHSLLSVLSGCETYEEMEYYGEAKIGLLREFYPYKNGIASNETVA